jgi:hypothetical protein
MSTLTEVAAEVRRRIEQPHIDPSAVEYVLRDRASSCRDDQRALRETFLLAANCIQQQREEMQRLQRVMAASFNQANGARQR